MERKEFLSLVGLGASALLTACLGGCSKSSDSSSSTAAPTNVDFTVDLSLPANAPLQKNGGYVYSNQVIVARTLTGSYIAVQQICTHERYSVVYEGNNHLFYCAGHGGTFSETGQVTGGPPPYGLTKYNTTVNGNLLRIYS